MNPITTIELQGGPFHGTYENTGLADATTTHIGMQFLSTPEKQYVADQRARLVRGTYHRTSVNEGCASFTWKQI